MNLLVSTNVYKPGQLARVIPHLHAFRGQIGVELFPMFDADCYEEELLHCLPEFEGIPVSFHGPYYETEHSARHPGICALHGPDPSNPALLCAPSKPVSGLSSQ